MASGESISGFVLKGVTSLNPRKELGRGAYGKVYEVKYCQTVCAAKEIHSILIEDVGETQRGPTIESFLRECRQCSVLRHPNVIQFLGVYYPAGEAGANRMQLPVMVMEMMADSLTSFVDKHEKIPVHIKYSIVHDISLGLCYLHNHDPPIVHRDLSPNNILLTAHHVAKISDLGVAKVIKADSTKTLTKAPGTIDFMPPESLANSPVYGPPMDVFSFAGIILHTFNQQWPRPSEAIQFDSTTRKMIALSEVQRRQQYLDKMIGEAQVLKSLVEDCLDYDPAVRPTITTVCERIQTSKDAYVKQSPQDNITLYYKNQRLRTENILQKMEVERQRVIIEKRAPPLTATLTSGRYHIKWTKLVNLPAPLYRAYAAVHHHKIYVTGANSPEKDAENKVYVYDINADKWGQLPPRVPGYCFGVPHIIGGKLAIIGGRDSVNNKRTNKVSTFDEDSQIWTSFYPDLLSVRSRPGVVSHLEHVIVAGGVKPTTEDDDKPAVQDDIEVLNWIENSHWRRVSVKLPVPMYGFTPTICDDNVLVVGYLGADEEAHEHAYKIPVVNITASIDQQHSGDASAGWSELTKADHLYTALVPSSSPPVVVGGQDNTGKTTADIKMYNNSNKSWDKVGSLLSPRSCAAVAVIYNNAIVVIGGCAKGGTTADRSLSSLKIVELGQVEL